MSYEQKEPELIVGQLGAELSMQRSARNGLQMNRS